MPGPSTNAPLFPKKAMDALIEADRWPLTDSDQLRAIAARWRDDLAAGRIRKSDETALYRQFINQFFVQTLGYRGFSEVDPGQSFTLKEVTGLGTGTGSIPDLSLGLFDPAASTEPPLVPVELKSANTPLERSYAGRDSAIHQMLRYLVQSRGDWAAASNIGEFRLYHRLAGLNRFQGWTLDELAGGPHRPRLEFHACLAAKNLVVRDGAGLTVLDRAFAAIGELQEKVSKEFYRDYKALRREMFDALRLLNPDYPPDKLLSKAQMLLDRLLFICFAEDRGLLPPNILAARLTGDLPPGRNPKTRNLQELFQGINEGWDHFKIPRYNGGLFRPDEDLDRMLQLDDRVADWALQLAKRDFYEEVSVDVLGHIFEQSITDLEELRAEVAGQQSDKRNSKRKREGVFYTPRYVTEYIVRHTVGTKVDELLKASEALYAPKISRARSDRARDAARAKQLEHFRNGVGSLRVVDPACGSGAFLLAAFEYLRRIYGDTQAEINRLLRDDLPFDPDDTILQRNLYGVDLNSESVEITKLSLWIATAKHGRLLTNLDDTIRMGNSLVDDHDIDPRAFDWQKSFPEVFEDGGFDCVIGNPPYVRQERIKHLKPYLAQKYECYDAAADLYTYFYELGLRILKQGGRLGFITSGQFFRSAYGKPLRGLLAERSRLDQVLHFGDYRVFKDALVRSPSILVVGRDQSADQVRVWINTSKTRLPDLLQENFLNQLGYSSPAADFGTGAWSFLSEDHRNVSKTLLARGTSLEETGHQRIYRGVVTGLNSTKGSNGLGVFVVDAIKRAELIGRDPKSAEILKPVLRGENLQPYHLEAEDIWLVFTRRGTRLDQYPAIAEHLLRFRGALEPQPPGWTDNGKRWPGRKPGDYEWYEIQDTVAYWREFEKPKILFPDICRRPRFVLDFDSFYCLNTIYVLPTDSWYLLGLLNSKAMWLAANALMPRLGMVEGLWELRMFKREVKRLPIPSPTPSDERIIAECAEACQDLGQRRYAKLEEVRHRLRTDLLAPHTDKPLSQKLSAWNTLDFNTFRAEVKRLSKQDIPLRERSEWEGYLATEAASVAQLSAELAERERVLNDAVNRAFELTPEECAIVNKVLDPVGVETDGEDGEESS